MKQLHTSVTKVIILTLVMVTTVVLSAFGVANYCWERSQRTTGHEEHLSVITAQLANSLALPLWNFDTEQIAAVVESTMRHKDISGVTITGIDGSGNDASFARDRQWRIVPTPGVTQDRSGLTKSQQIVIHGKHVGTVHVFMTLRFMEKSLQNFAAIVIAAIVTLNVFLIFIPFQLIRRKVIKPLQSIESYALKVSSGEADAATVPEGDFFGELKNLKDSIVGMTRSLAEARRAQVRKTAEQALREGEKTLKAVLDVMPVGVTWTDSNGVIKHVNDSFTEWFGYDTEDIPTLDAWLLRAYPDPDKREKYHSHWQAFLDSARNEGTAFQSTESIISSKDGSERHVIVNTHLARNLRLDIFTDITERESLQNRLLNAQRLESLGVLAGGIAHDFNNILTGILGNISMARSILDIPDKLAKLLDNAEKATVRASELATQLLTFAKGGAPVKKTVSLGKIVHESLSLALRGTNVKGVVDIPVDLHDIEADEGQISQVCNNLVINAVQAMPEGGTITVAGMNVTLAAENSPMLPSGSYIRLSFSDEGYGMSEAVQKKIFDPYFTTKTNGMGLGLASVHSIITRHGGHIEVNSKVGTGTTFTLLLPSTGKTSSEEEIGERVTQCGTLAGGSVLVMDDEEMIRELAAEMLSHLSYEVTTCATGEEAVSHYCAAKEVNKPFSLCIMDLTIPGGMGGREGAATILAFDPCARLIASSGYANDPVMADFRDYGFCAAIVKPYTQDNLVQVVRAALGCKQAVAP
jgi:two-component system, cell cycle sensor histidine kinase and response regulator CckA